MNNVNDEFKKLLCDFERVPKSIKSKTIFDIARYPHYENVNSNILAFYLNPNNEHGLGNLFLSSLIEVSGGEIMNNQKTNIQVSREVSTQKGGRLDIVIETDNQIIGIENKIYHYLNNDLLDYSNSIDKWAEPNSLDKLKIVLSIRDEKKKLKNENSSLGFINITYEDYWKKIKENMGNYVSTSSQKWLFYLIDFMSNIEKLKGRNMEFDETDKFFMENEDRVDNLIIERNKFISKLNTMIKDLLLKINEKRLPKECKKQWIYQKTCLVHDYELSGNLISFDIYISPKGWELKLFGRNKDSHKYLKELLIPTLRKNYSMKEEKSRYILETYDLITDLGTITDNMIKCFEHLIEAENELKK